MALPSRKRIKRRINVAGQESPAERQSRTAVRFIMDNRYYPMILKAIRDGTPNSKIAEFGIARGWFDVNQKTVVSYLQYFRKAQPGVCRPQPNGENEFGFSDLFDGNSIIIDEETELLRLIKLQQARLGIAFRNEREIGMLMQSNRREVEELRNLLIDLAKLRGLIGNTLDVNVNGYNQTVREDLKGIQQDEAQRGVIAMLVQDLVGVSNGG